MGDHWSANLQVWYREAVEMVKKNLRPGFVAPAFGDIRWKVTPRRSGLAGQCLTGIGYSEIWLNPVMTLEHARSTFRHELAHLFANRFECPHAVRNYHHGFVFRKWARAMGDDGGRCHNYPEVIANKKGSWAHCPYCQAEIKKVFRAPINLYRCRGCRVPLVPGPLTPEKRFVFSLVAHGPGPDWTTDESFDLLKTQLQALKETGMGSSPAAKKIRRQLRRIDRDWRNR